MYGMYGIFTYSWVICWVNVGIFIPAPWFAYGDDLPINSTIGMSKSCAMFWFPQGYGPQLNNLEQAFRMNAGMYGVYPKWPLYSSNHGWWLEWGRAVKVLDDGPWLMLNVWVLMVLMFDGEDTHNMMDTDWTLPSGKLT